jgi:hypothetical protein
VNKWSLLLISNAYQKSDEVSQRRESKDFSSLYQIVFSLPTSEASAPPPATSPVLPKPERKEPYFAHIGSLFTPTPFVPTHPTWRHLAGVAETESNNLRTAAEEEVAQIVQEKTARLQEQETELRSQVETLWRIHQAYTSRVYNKGQISSNGPNSRDHFGEITASSSGATETPTSGAPQTVREFVPSKTATRPSSVRQPRISSLSASLATSTFHHPKALELQSPEGRIANGGAQSPASLESASSITLTAYPQRGEDNSVLRFRRNNDDTANTAVSYRFFVNLEEEMQRRDSERKAQFETAGHNGQLDQPAEPEKAPLPPQTESQANEVTSPNGKGKRKVTFDVQTNGEGEKSETDDGPENSPDEGKIPCSIPFSQNLYSMVSQA